MHTDPVDWSRIRDRLLSGCESLRQVSRTEHIHRQTLKRILASATPSRYLRKTAPPPPVMGQYLVDLEKLVDANHRVDAGHRLTAQGLYQELARRGFSGSYRVVLHHVHRLERRQAEDDGQDVQTRIAQLSDHDSAVLLRAIIRRCSHSTLDAEALKRHMSALSARHQPKALVSGPAERWGQWLAQLERACGRRGEHPLFRQELLGALNRASRLQRQRVMCVLAHQDGFSSRQISALAGVSRNSVRQYLDAYREGGCGQLLGRKAVTRLADSPDLKQALFGLLHEPPSQSGFNRSTWRLIDLRAALKTRGFAACTDVIRKVIRESGYRWRSAKVVLTSHDPEYREKLAHIQNILAGLKPDERFFSIDEFGPFSVKKKGGRTLAPPDVQPTVPQWQKSKGCLILTAALELSTNQVSHFYSEAKNTQEMIRMAAVLVDENRNAAKLYLSWDAASWHMSKKLIEFVSTHNDGAVLRGEPTIELAPLPATAQFLNVIESVFSGMARSIIHCSDYDSKDAAATAIDRYFLERNEHFRDHPQRAGKKIWGRERVAADFSDSNNCKDPKYR